MLRGDSIGRTMLSLALIQLLGRDSNAKGFSLANRAVLLPGDEVVADVGPDHAAHAAVGCVLMFHSRAIRLARSSERKG
jgi:hypothetical protein